MPMNISETLEQISDEELVRRSVANPDDFAHLIRRYESKLLRYIKRSTNVSPEDAEDLLQEIFIKTYQHLNGFDPSLRFSSWIYRISHNHIVSAHRKKSARPETYSPEEGELERVASAIDIASDLERTELSREVRRTLDKLDPKYRDALILQFVEEKSYQEISDILKKPLGTVATLISRAKKRFGDAWSEEHPPSTV